MLHSQKVFCRCSSFAILIINQITNTSNAMDKNANKPYNLKTHHIKTSKGKLKLFDSMAMAIGGMIGGGIFSVLGTSISIAGHLAFMSFLIGGIIAALTAKSYAVLSIKAKTSGGPFVYLKLAGYKKSAPIVTWILIFGYVLTLAVYSFTFGHYAASLLNGSAILARLFSILAILVFFLINTRGVSSSATTENLIVTTKILILAVISFIGLSHFETSRLQPLANNGWLNMIIAATTIFVAYEGFELLPYDYSDMEKPERNLPKALIRSVIIVTIIYIVVTIGSQMLVSDSTIISQKEVAFITIGQAALGSFGKFLASFAALLATCSAINATLFSTARQIHDVAEHDELPRLFAKDSNGLPKSAMAVLSILGVLFAMLPNVSTLLNFGSFVFLIIFAIVNFLAIKISSDAMQKLLSTTAFLACVAAILTLLIQLAKNDVPSLILIFGCLLLLAILRIWFVKNRAQQRT